MKKPLLFTIAFLLFSACSLLSDGHHYVPQNIGASGAISSGEVLNSGTAGDIYNFVPFAPQAPFGHWEDQRMQDGCEEMSSIMAVKWAGGEELTYEQARDLLIDISGYEDEYYGSNKDTSAEDTLERIIEGYFSYHNATILEAKDVQVIKDVLAHGGIVLAPMAGKKLHNPYFSGEGPLKHMLVIIGYDVQKEQFIVNDPGTKRGKDFVYDANTIMSALYNYPTTGKEASEAKHAIIAVYKEQ